MRRVAVPIAAALVALAGCGSPGDSAPTATPTQAPATQDAPPPPKLGPISVARPMSGRVVRAHAVGAELVATLRVSGRADPRQIVYTQASCTRSSCEQLAPTDGRGRWSTSSVVVVAADAPQLSVDAGYTDPASGRQPVTVRVTLRAAGARRAAQHHVRPVPVVPLPPIPAPAATPVTPAPAAVPPVTPTTATRPLIMIGDSLAVGTQADLAADLPGWAVTTNARIGRPLAEGMGILARTPVGDPRTILAFSLFTNDLPANVGALRSAVAQSVADLGAHGCAIWATIHRPPLNGVSYAPANAALAQLAASPALAGRLEIVPWAHEVAAHPQWLAPDHVHATRTGYAARAQLYANAAQSCTA